MVFHGRSRRLFGRLLFLQSFGTQFAPVAQRQPREIDPAIPGGSLKPLAIWKTAKQSSLGKDATPHRSGESGE